MNATSSPSSPGLTGRSSIPEKLMKKPRGRGVLDPPPARGMTAIEGGASPRQILQQQVQRRRGEAV